MLQPTYIPVYQGAESKIEILIDWFLNKKYVTQGNQLRNYIAGQHNIMNFIHDFD